jgi:hypothetical protein
LQLLVLESLQLLVQESLQLLVLESLLESHRQRVCMSTVKGDHQVVVLY